jgi:SET domain-containing protein
MFQQHLYIDKTQNKGNAVFARSPIPADTVIEVAPVIVMDKKDREHLDKTLLHDYIFEWGEQKDKCAMALGWVPVYNHSYTSNCEYFMDYTDNTIMVKTVRAIDPGEELTINYNGDWNDTTPVWFEVN